jgi:hypothetical protein
MNRCPLPDCGAKTRRWARYCSQLCHDVIRPFLPVQLDTDLRGAGTPGPRLHEFVLRTGGHIHRSSSTFNALQFSYQAIPLRFSWGLIRRTAGA